MTSTRIEERTEELARLHAQVFGEPEPARADPVPAPPPTSLSDLELIAKMRAARNGAKFSALFDGDFSAYESQSEADLALTNMIAFFTGPDRDRIDRLFRQSGLVRAKWNEKRGERTYGEITIDRAWEGRVDYYSPNVTRRNGRNGHDGSVATAEDRQAFPLTDAGNAELLAHLHGARLRYDHRRQRWLHFGGHHWRPDLDGQTLRLAKNTTRERLRLAADIDGKDQREKAAKFAIASENRQRLEAMLALAQAEPPVADLGDGWDADPMLLGVANGVVDLRTGVLRDGRPDDRITLTSPVAYDPHAVAERWEQFLAEIFDGSQAIIHFVQRASGYSLTGNTSEHALFLNYGTGSNGKSVYLNMIRRVAGGYGHNLPFTALELATRTQIPADIAQLPSRRLVTSSETTDGARLNEARIKMLTGGDPVTAAEKFKAPFTFLPVCKLWLAVNHLPDVKDDSDGFWRRMRVIPFRKQFKGDEIDPMLEKKLAAEMPGILAWMVRGAMAWARDGLTTPQGVVMATDAYRTESDPLNEFLADCCVLHQDAEVGAGPLFKRYGTWADDQGLRGRERLGSRTFGSRVKERFKSRHTKRGRIYQGIGLRAPDPEGGAEVTGDGLEGRSGNLSLETPRVRDPLGKPVTTRHPSPISDDPTRFYVSDAVCAQCGGDRFWRQGETGGCAVCAPPEGVPVPDQGGI